MMLKQIGRGIGVLLSALLLGAAVWRRHDPADDEADDAHNDDDSSGAGWGVTGYYAAEDLAPMRLALTEWLERYSIVYKSELASGGGGATFSRGRLVFDAGGGGFGNKPEVDNDVTFGGGQGGVGVGLALIQNRLLRVYPLVGFGGMGGGVDNADGDVPKGGWYSAFFSTGLGIDLRLTLWRVGLLVGLRIGYRHDVMNAQFADGVAFEQPRGPFIRFVIGPYVG